IPAQSELEIIIQLSADYPVNHSGLDELVYLGTPRAINEQVWFNVGAQLTIVIVLLIHLIYVIILYSLGVRQSGIIYFAAFIIVAALTVLVTDDRLLFSWIPMNYEWSLKTLELTYFGVSILLLEF